MGLMGKDDEGKRKSEVETAEDHLQKEQRAGGREGMTVMCI